MERNKRKGKGKFVYRERGGEKKVVASWRKKECDGREGSGMEEGEWRRVT